jgi:hypothetical protein
MSFFSSLLGGSPEMMKDTAADNALVGSANGLVSSANSSFLPAMFNRMASLNNTGWEKSQMAGQGNADVSQGVGPAMTAGGRGPAFQNMLNRGRALAKITAFGDNAVTGQSVRDRITALAAARGIRTPAFYGQSTLAAGQNQTQTADYYGERELSSAKLNFAGAVLGAGIRGGAALKPGESINPNQFDMGDKIRAGMPSDASIGPQFSTDQIPFRTGSLLPQVGGLPFG